MRVLITGHKGFIGSNVYLDWQETLGYVNVEVHHLKIPINLLVNQR